jgi:septum site-determining protein MinD
VIILTRTIAIVSGKGGVGKTTVVTNLGMVLVSHFKKDVIIVDCNITTSHLGLYFGMYYYPVTLNQVLKGEAKIDSAIYNHFSGLKLIPASLSVEDLEGVDISKLKRSLKKLLGKTDFILLDSAPGLGREAMATFNACDEIIYVTTPYVPSISDVIRCKRVAEDVNVKEIGVVLNMTRNEKHELTKEDVEKLIELPVIASIPYDRKVLESLSMKIPIVVLESNSKISKEFVRLAGVLLGKEYKPEAEGFIQKLKRFLFRR